MALHFYSNTQYIAATTVLLLGWYWGFTAEPQEQICRQLVLRQGGQGNELRHKGISWKDKVGRSSAHFNILKDQLAV